MKVRSSRRGRVHVIEGPDGWVLLRSRGNTVRVKAHRFDGDAIAEMRMAATAASIVQESYRRIVGDPKANMVQTGPMRHIEDHG